MGSLRTGSSRSLDSRSLGTVKLKWTKGTSWKSLGQAPPTATQLYLSLNMICSALNRHIREETASIFHCEGLPSSTPEALHARHPLTLGLQSLFPELLGTGNTHSYTRPGCGIRSLRPTLSTFLELVQTERLGSQSCRSTESHSHRQQGPPGSDGNTNTTYDSIKEVVIKTGEQRAVASRMESSHRSPGIWDMRLGSRACPGGGRWYRVGTHH